MNSPCPSSPCIVQEEEIQEENFEVIEQPYDEKKQFSFEAANSNRNRYDNF
jgi:hypothetical protein